MIRKADSEVIRSDCVDVQADQELHYPYMSKDPLLYDTSHNYGDVMVCGREVLQDGAVLAVLAEKPLMLLEKDESISLTPPCLVDIKEKNWSSSSPRQHIEHACIIMKKYFQHAQMLQKYHFFRIIFSQWIEMINYRLL